jgi:7-cyano-7-deazaguanine synthase
MNAILLSGGMDSLCIAAWKKPSIAYTIDYGQTPANGEIRAAIGISKYLNIPHVLLKVDCAEIGSGDLAGTLPLACAPATDWWPFRNQLLITIAAARALKDGVSELLFGSVKGDQTHVDGSAEFFNLIEKLLMIQEGNLRVTAPALPFTTAELIRKVDVPFELLAWSHSCHSSEFACGQCRGCVKHAAVMRELGFHDY